MAWNGAVFLFDIFVREYPFLQAEHFSLYYTAFVEPSPGIVKIKMGAVHCYPTIKVSSWSCWIVAVFDRDVEDNCELKFKILQLWTSSCIASNNLLFVFVISGKDGRPLVDTY